MREGTGLVSHSQYGSGAWLTRLPDATLRDSDVESSDFLTRMQRRVGLYVTLLAPHLDERSARGDVATQHERLGDHAINAANKTARHNAGLYAIHRALNSVAGTVWRLGDRGDPPPTAPFGDPRPRRAPMSGRARLPRCLVTARETCQRRY